MSNIALLIPIYEPSNDVFPFLESIADLPVSEIVVVNDGSSEEFNPIFEKIAKLPLVRVVSYEKNRGKGAALKFGLKEIVRINSNTTSIITADGDGQHCKEDILKLINASEANPSSLIIGVRNFKDPSVPKHNRYGNWWSSLYFRLMTRTKLSDTQSGLRAIPKECFSLFLNTMGSRYDFEMAFLMDAVKEVPLIQVPVKTIYNNNEGSHFRPFVDSVRIYKMPLIYIGVALASAAVDLSLFYLFTAIGPSDQLYKILVATVGARLISGIGNFLMNYFVVFKHKGQVGIKIFKYSIVFVINMFLSFGLTYLFDFLPMGIVFVKFIVDFVIFIINYLISYGWIFAKKKVKAHDSRKRKS